MGNWKQYLFSLLICSLTCGVVSQLISDTGKKALIHLICGIIFSICILFPLTQLKFEDFCDVPVWNQSAAEIYIADGKKTAAEAQAKCIEAECEAYILDKARTLGADVMVQVTLNQAQIPVFAELSGEAAPYAQRELEKILMTDLGIPKENQKWIWNQESNSS